MIFLGFSVNYSSLQLLIQNWDVHCLNCEMKRSMLRATSWNTENYLLNKLSFISTVVVVVVFWWKFSAYTSSNR